MPHRLEYLISLKLAAGGIGTAISSWSLWHLAQMDPDHLKLLMVTIGGVSLWFLRMGIKDVTSVWVPNYVSARKQLKQMDLDMRDMERKQRESEAKNEAAIVGAKEEALAKADEIERVAAEKRHALADRLQAALSARELELYRAQDRIATLEFKLGITAETHRAAINAVSDGLTDVAQTLDPPVDVPHPHLGANGDNADKPIPVPGERP